MSKEEFVKKQMKLSKEDMVANYWYTYQDNVERLGIEHQLELKNKEIERLNNIINELEKDTENRLMSISNEICDNSLEEIKRTTKIAVYQVILGKLEKLKENNQWK